MTLRVGLALLLLPTLAGCFSLQLTHVWVDEPISDAALAALVPGEVELGQCLHALGAPHFVWEYDGDGAALAWGWIDQSAFGFQVSLTLQRYAPTARFAMSWNDQAVVGAVLFFDSELRLLEVRQGFLRDLAPQGIRRPAPVTDPDDETDDETDDEQQPDPAK